MTSDTGKFVAIGMRTKVDDPTAMVVNTCSGNDTADVGDATRWTWANPTNRAIFHPYEDIVAVSLECLWQGTKMTGQLTRPDPRILGGNWRLAKGRKPRGAYAGPDKPLITTPGEARRKIYIPAFKRLFDHWMTDQRAIDLLNAARAHQGIVYLRDHDTGQGIDRNGAMSHAWVLSVFLNTGQWPN